MATKKTQNQKQDDVVAYAQKLIDYGRSGMEHNGVLRKREKAINYRNGRHKIKMRQDRYGNQVWNKFGQIAHQRLAHILSKKPRWRFLPRQEGAIYAADALNDLVGNVMWDMISWEDKGEISVNEAWNCGTSHVKGFVRKNGFPDAIPVSANQIIVDPDAKREKDRRFWVHVYPMSVNDILEEWGVKVKAEAIVDDIDKGTVQKSYEEAGNNQAPSEIFKDKDGQWASEAVGNALVYEVWSGDGTLEAVPFQDQEVIEEHEAFRNFVKVNVEAKEHHPKHIKAHEIYLASLDPELDQQQILTITEHISEHESYPQKDKRKKYPFGRKTMICQGNYLEDGPNPYALVMDVPVGYNDLLLKWDYDIVDDSYWGKSGGHDLFDPQDAINHRKNAITQMINRMNHGIKTMLTRSFESLRGSFKKLNNLIGTIIPVKNHDDLKIDFGPPFPPQIFQDEYHSEQFMDELGHKTDLMSGQLPKGSPPGVVVNQLLGQGMVAIDLVVTHYARMLQRLARLMSHLMIEFVPPNTMFRMLDNKNNWQFIAWDQIKEQMGMYDIHVDVDSMLSTSRQEKLDRALQLYQATVYDRQAVLDKVDDPDKYEIMQRMSEILMLEKENAQLRQGLEKVVNEYDRLDQNYRAAQQKINEKGKSDASKKG
jgi:hypothetical protein